MKLSSIKRGLTENIGVKLIAFVVAAMIWFNASGEEEVKRPFVAPLKFVSLPDTLIITGNVPAEVEVNVVVTKRELLYLGFKKMVARVNLSRSTPGKGNYTLSPSDLLLPPGIELGNIRMITPSSVNLTIERIASKEVEVSVTLTGSLPDNHLLNRVPEADPERVTVSGPESAVRQLKSLATKPIDLGKIRETLQREVELDFDRKVYQSKPDKVTVSVSISARGKRVLANLPPTILIDDRDLAAEVTPKTVSLTLEGPQALLDTISSGDVSVLVDLSGKPPGKYTLAPEVIVPNGVAKFAMNVDSLKIVISRQPKS